MLSKGFLRLGNRRVPFISSSTEPLHLIVLVVAIGTLYFFVGIFDHSLWSPTEPAVAGIVWNMYTYSDLAVPHINNIPYLEKPPLYYWTSLAACKALGGLDDGLIRLPSVIFGVLSLVLVYWIANKKYGNNVANVTVLLGATCSSFYELSHRACTDIAATFFIFLAFSIFMNTLDADTGTQDRKTKNFDILFCLILSLAFYAKNFYVHLIVLPPVVTYLLLKRQYRRTVGLFSMLVLFLVVMVTPWCLALYHEGGWELLRIVFVDNTLGRFFHIAVAGNIASEPLNDAYIAEKGKSTFFYLGSFFTIMQPWLLIFATAIVALYRKKQVSEFQQFLKITFIVIPVVLSLSTSKVTEYLIPILFILLLISGDFLNDVFHQTRKLTFWETALVGINITLFAIALVIFPFVESFLVHKPILILWTIPIALFLFLLWKYVRKNRFDFLFLHYFLSFSAVMLFVLLVNLVPYIEDLNATKYFFTKIEKTTDHRKLYTTFYGDRRLPIITYYLNRRITVLTNHKSVFDELRSIHKVGIIIPSDFYIKNIQRFNAIPHTIIKTSRGRDIFTFVFNHDK